MTDPENTHVQSPIDRFVRKLAKHLPNRRKKRAKPDTYDQLDCRSEDQLLAIVRHEAHRIEKSIYNNAFESRSVELHRKRQRIEECMLLLTRRGFPRSDDESFRDPTLRWASEIIEAFDQLQSYIECHSSSPAPFDPDRADEFIGFVKQRRSVRVWADDQPSEGELQKFARQMIDAARWSPSSGNRQPWRFVCITDPVVKNLLQGIKENHCTESPLLIFVGLDSRFYGALGAQERSLFIDGGAAIMQMLLTAHHCGLGACWNHFADDLLSSRERNQGIYDRFARHVEIPDWISPVAVIAAGRPSFIPPTPARTDVDDLIIGTYRSAGLPQVERLAA